MIRRVVGPRVPPLTAAAAVSEAAQERCVSGRTQSAFSPAAIPPSPHGRLGVSMYPRIFLFRNQLCIRMATRFSFLMQTGGMF